MHFIFLLVVSFFFVGCATVGSYQAECEQKNTEFKNIVQCLKISTSSDSRMINNPKIKLYLLKADQLNQKIENKEISEIDAKLELQEYYLKLKQNEELENKQVSEALMKYSEIQKQNQNNISNAYWAPQQTLKPLQTPVNCTSQYLSNGVVNTTCR